MATDGLPGAIPADVPQPDAPASPSAEKYVSPVDVEATTTMTAGAPKQASEDAPVLPMKEKVAAAIMRTDRVGNTVAPDAELEYDPGMETKTIAGMICSNFWLLVYLAVCCVFFYRLWDDGNAGAVPGDEAWLWFNHHCHVDEAELAKNLAMGDRPVMKLPTFQVRIDAKLTQFEQDRPSLQGLEVIDDTGYFRHPITSKDAVVPGVKSVHQHLKVPLNGFDEDLSRVSPKTPVPTDDIDSTFARAAAHRFTSETLKARYQELGIFEAGEPFYPHSSYLFARFQPEQLKNLKSCQLQVFMANAAEFNPLVPDWKYNLPMPTSLATSQFTWTPTNWLDDPKLGKSWKHPDFNLLSLEKHIGTQPAGSTAGFTSWVFGTAYSNNFQHTFDKMMCDDDQLTSESLAEQIAIAPDATSTTLMVLGRNPVLSGAESLGQGYAFEGAKSSGVLDRPFYLLVSGLMGKERVKVTAVTDCSAPAASCVATWEGLDNWGGTDNCAGVTDLADDTACLAMATASEFCVYTPASTTTTACTSLTIERDSTNPVDFAKPPPLDRDVAEVMGTPFPLVAPATWTCNPKRYWAGDACDCECGAFDPDCFDFGVEVLGCATKEKETCSLGGTCTNLGPQYINEQMYFADDESEPPLWLQRSVAKWGAANPATATDGCPAFMQPGGGNEGWWGDNWCDADFTGAAEPGCSYDNFDCLKHPEYRDDTAPWLGLVYLSVECERLYLNGDTELAGFAGSEASFAAADGACEICPGDEMFGGNPIRNANGEYVCDGSPEGTVDTSIDFAADVDCAATPLGRDCLTNEVAIEVFPSYGTPFPAAHGNMCVDAHASGRAVPITDCSSETSLANSRSCLSVRFGTDEDNCEGVTGACTDGLYCKFVPGNQYRVALSAGHANQELVYVQEATPLANGKQTLAVTLQKTPHETNGYTKPLKEKHIARGTLLSAITPESTTVVVSPALGYEFDSLGPYTVYIRGTSLTVSSAKTYTRAKIPFQTLTLANPPEYEIGLRTTLIEAQARELQTLFTVSSDPKRSWKLLEATDALVAVIQPPGKAPTAVKVENVWPSAWLCPGEFFNDGLYCDTNCGIFDPDCGRARNCGIGPLFDSDCVIDGYWYINPARKRCAEGVTSVQEDQALGEFPCWVQRFSDEDADGSYEEWEGEEEFSADHDPDAPGDAFGYVTWDNIDLDRDGTYEFRSGDLVPSGTVITLDGADYAFDPYEKSHRGNDIPDVDYVCYDSSECAFGLATCVMCNTRDGLPPIHTPPYHPGAKARYGDDPSTTDDAVGYYWGTEYVHGQYSFFDDAGDVSTSHETFGDLPALTKWQKLHPAGADVLPFFSSCGCSGTGCDTASCGTYDPDEDGRDLSADADARNDYMDCACMPLDVSWRNFAVTEPRTAIWEAGSVLLFMDALELSKGFYLEDNLPAGTAVTTAKMPLLPFLEEHSNPLITELPEVVPIAKDIDPEDIPLDDYGLADDFNDQTVSRFFDVKLIRTEDEYLPADRYKPSKKEKTQSPAVMDVDVSLFTVPDRQSFADGLDYCPDITLTTKEVPYMFTEPSPGDMTSWKIRAGRNLKIKACTSQTLTSATDQCITTDELRTQYPGQYRTKCTTDMPPTHVFEFQTELYANNKWLYDGESWSGYNRPDNGKYAAEYAMQVSHVYKFSHALMDDDTENAMAESMPPSKDTDQTGAKLLYTGANAYRGTGRTGSPSEVAGFPANAPFLDSIVHFYLAPEALDDVYACQSEFWVYEKDWMKEVLDKFPAFNVTFDYSLVGGSNQQLLLEPGYVYKLSAVVHIAPILKMGRLEYTFMDSFMYKTISTSVERTRTDYFHRREALVTYAIEFDNSAMEFTLTHNYPLSAFISDVCAMTMIMGLAHWFVKNWHKLTKRHIKLFTSLEQRAIDARQDVKDAEQDERIATDERDIDQLQARLAKIEADMAAKAGP